MKLTFESNLQYQQQAIKSITGLFEGQPFAKQLTSTKIVKSVGHKNISNEPKN